MATSSVIRFGLAAALVISAAGCAPVQAQAGQTETARSHAQVHAEHRAQGAHAHAATTTVVVVRHAEKVDDSADPLLSEPGRARALALAESLADAGVTHVITTQFQRTVLTGAPLAERLGITPTVVAASGRTHVDDVAARVRELAGGGTIVVVGHSNTVPAIVRALGGPDVGAIDDSEYDHLFILTLDEAGVRVIRSRYGT